MIRQAMQAAFTYLTHFVISNSLSRQYKNFRQNLLTKYHQLLLTALLELIVLKKIAGLPFCGGKCLNVVWDSNI